MPGSPLRPALAVTARALRRCARPSCDSPAATTRSCCQTQPVHQVCPRGRPLAWVCARLLCRPHQICYNHQACHKHQACCKHQDCFKHCVPPTC
eukprot:353453-Chlamydomonas_euryale.AAC.8